MRFIWLVPQQDCDGSQPIRIFVLLLWLTDWLSLIDKICILCPDILMICNCPWVIRSRRNHKWVSENVIQAYIGKELFPLNADRFLSQMPSKMCRQIMSCSTIQHVASTSVFHTRYISEELLMEGDPVKFKCTSLRASLCNSIFSNFGQYLHKVYLLYQNYDNNCDNIAKRCIINTVWMQWFLSLLTTPILYLLSVVPTIYQICD